MPCYDSRNDYPHEEMNKLQTKLNEVTKLLCATCREIEDIRFNYAETMEQTKMQYTLDRIPGLRKWWDRHKKIDKLHKRLDNERKNRYYNNNEPTEKKVLRVSNWKIKKTKKKLDQRRSIQSTS